MNGGLWFLAGGVAGGLNALSTRWSVRRIHPATPRRALVYTLGGALARWGLAAVLLAQALRQGIVPGLLAWGGLWLVWRVLAWHLVAGRTGTDVIWE